MPDPKRSASRPADGLKIPFAYLPDGTAVRPENADRHGIYACPVCGEPLAYRSGPRVRPHFAHLGGGLCASYETILHHVAKHKLAERIVRSISGEAPRQSFRRQCPLCDAHAVHQLIPIAVASVELETDEASGYRPDLTLLDVSGRALCAVEVVVTSPVGEEKAQHMSLPWIELRAEEVMEGLERPAGEYLVHRDALRLVVCTPCQATVRDEHQKAARILDRWNVGWPDRSYDVSYGACWKCNTVIPFFRWDSSWSKDAPPNPRPRTVQRRHSNTTRSSYWANTCPACRAIQGDWFTFHQPGGAFLPAYGDGAEAKQSFLMAQHIGALDPVTGRLHID